MTMTFTTLSVFISTLCLLFVTTNPQTIAKRNYGNYGYNFYGNYYGCGGRGWYTIRCPDRTVSPGNCASTLSCTQFSGYTCISPGICCRTATATNVCPSGLTTSLTCPGGTCGTNNGLVCVNGICCIGTTTAACPDGQAGVGSCLVTASGLSCGTGFQCRTVGGQNLCCPTATVASAVGTSVCPDGRRSTTMICTDSHHCTGIGGRCFNGHCCPQASTRNSATALPVCPGDKEPAGICTDKNTTCPNGSMCGKTNGFCCPSKKLI